MDMLWPFSSITPPSVYLLLLMFSSHTLHLLIYIFNTSAWSHCISLLSWSAFTGLFPLLLLLLISFILSLIPHPHFQILVFPFEPALNLIAMAAKEASQRCRVCVCMYIWPWTKVCQSFNKSNAYFQLFHGLACKDDNGWIECPAH